MTEHELIFEVFRPAEAQVEALYAQEDALVSTHGRTVLLTLTAPGVSVQAAARASVKRLAGLGIIVTRLYEDLVARAEIARRAGLTSQAVGLWVRGERRQTGATPFPEPFTYAGGASELWLWSEVNAWLAGLDLADGLSHPSRADYVVVNAWLLARGTPARPERSLAG